MRYITAAQHTRIAAFGCTSALFLRSLRVHFAEPEALHLASISLLLADYRRLAATAPLPASTSNPATAAAAAAPETLNSEPATSRDNATRFAHLAAADVRLSELPQLLAGYRQLFQAAAPAPSAAGLAATT